MHRTPDKFDAFGPGGASANMLNDLLSYGSRMKEGADPGTFVTNATNKMPVLTFRDHSRKSNFIVGEEQAAPPLGGAVQLPNAVGILYRFYGSFSYRSPTDINGIVNTMLAGNSSEVFDLLKNTGGAEGLSQTCLDTKRAIREERDPYNDDSVFDGISIRNLSATAKRQDLLLL